MPTVYDRGRLRIEKVGNGYVLTIREVHGNRIILITSDGGMLDTTLRGIDLDDRQDARAMLPMVDGGNRVNTLQLHNVDRREMGSDMAILLRRWEQSQGQNRQ